MKSRLLLASASTLVAILLCEALLWLFAGTVYPPPLYPGDVEPERDATFDPLVGWKLPPGAVLPEVTDEYSVTYRANRQGFRSRRDFSLERSSLESDPLETSSLERSSLEAVSPGAPGRRIALIGDSYTFGSGVEDDETFAALLEARLPDTWCDNFGIGAWGIDQMWMALRHYALPLEPDLVILSFIRYDLDRSLSAYRRDHVWRWKPTFRLSGGELVPLTLDSRPGAAVRFLTQKSRLYRVWRKLENSLSRRFAVGYRWRLNRALFAAIRDDCRRAGVPLVVVHVPINRRSPAPVLAREFAELDVAFLDLEPLLPADADALYYPRDRHFNAAGHRFAAEAIHRFLVARGLV